MSSKVYSIVTDAIIKKMQEGNIPWHRPFNVESPMNYLTRRYYTGINRWLLDAGEYITFTQAKKLGGKVKKGSKSHIVVLFKPAVHGEDKETGEEIYKPAVFKYYREFEINDVDGLESKIEKHDNKKLLSAEEVINNYKDKPEINISSKNNPSYIPTFDIVNMVKMEDCKSSNDYYATLFHELVHSTGNADRLNRFTPDIDTKFGSQDYSKEELIAEIGSAILCNECGISTEGLFDNSVAYVQNWSKVLKEDEGMIVSASSKAEKAVNYILGRNPYKKDNN